MKIKVVLVTEDESYSSRLRERMVKRYYNNIQLTAFNDVTSAALKAKELRPDIFLVDDELEYEGVALPKRCALAVLISESGIKSIRGVPAVAKYQSAADIVGDLTDIYAKRAEEEGIRFEGRDASRKKIVSFFPSAGGAGSSTLAAAYATYLAARGESVLYLNLETLGSADTYFAGSDKNNFDKVLYALQMNSSGTTLKLENALNRDADGVYFYSASTSALDMQDLNGSRMELLFDELSKSELFEFIVVDMDFTLGDIAFKQIERSDAAVFVSDGSAVANAKLKRLSDALELKISQESAVRLLLMYNRFSSKNSQKAQNTIFTEAGGVGRIENASVAELVDIVSKSGSFSGLTNAIGA